MTKKSIIRPASSADSQRIADIYNHYIIHSVVTFEEQSITGSEIDRRIRQTRTDQLPYIVAEFDERIIGYAYASKWKGRCAYRHSAEVSVYLAPDATGHGYGGQLYKVLFAELRERSCHVALAGIALPNPASVALHEHFGMNKVAHMKEVGFKFNKWVDVGYWQLILDSQTDFLRAE